MERYLCRTTGVEELLYGFKLKRPRCVHPAPRPLES